MKEIKNQIEQLNKYFKNKILNGDYNFIKSSEYTAEILIDGRYTFNFWIANTSDAFNQYSIDKDKLTIIHVSFTEQEKETAYNKMMIEVNKYKKTYLKDEKIKAIEKLQKEVKEIENE